MITKILIMVKILAMKIGKTLIMEKKELIGSHGISK